MSAQPRSRRQRLADLIVSHPRPIGYFCLIGFGLGIGVLAFVGATRSAAIVPVYTDPVRKCDYNAVEALSAVGGRSCSRQSRICGGMALCQYRLVRNLDGRQTGAPQRCCARPGEQTTRLARPRTMRHCHLRWPVWAAFKRRWR